MKRFLALVLLSATILGSLFLLSSCSSKTYNGIFYYKVNRNNTVCIKSLTPKGKELQSLTIPDKIDGYPVCQVGFHPPLLDASFYSDNLQRIYLPNTFDCTASYRIASTTLSAKLMVLRLAFTRTFTISVSGTNLLN